MAGKSSIERLPKTVKDRLQKHLRENRLTLDEIIADMRSAFPAEDAPSRSAVGRYKQTFEEAVAQQREVENMAQLWVRELKDAPQGKMGRLVAELLRTLAARAAMDMTGKGEIDIKNLRMLALAFNAAESGSKRESENRSMVREEVKRELLAEQEATLKAMEGEGFDKNVLNAVGSRISVYLPDNKR